MQKHDISRIEIIKCSFEADQEIAKYCQQHDNSYCYGKDSDFLIFADCPYVEFGELLRHGVMLVAKRVWYRAMLCGYLCNCRCRDPVGSLWSMTVVERSCLRRRFFPGGMIYTLHMSISSFAKSFSVLCPIVSLLRGEDRPGRHTTSSTVRCFIPSCSMPALLLLRPTTVCRYPTMRCPILPQKRWGWMIHCPSTCIGKAY